MDDVLTAATMAVPGYGCAFSNNATGPDDVKFTINLHARIMATTTTTTACPVK